MRRVTEEWVFVRYLDARTENEYPELGEVMLVNWSLTKRMSNYVYIAGRQN
jgi:hypothetical protein